MSLEIDQTLSPAAGSIRYSEAALSGAQKLIRSAETVVSSDY